MNILQGLKNNKKKMKKNAKNLNNGKTEKTGLNDDELPKVTKGRVRLKKKFFGLTRKDKKKLKKKPETAFLIRMFFSNGTSKEFVIETKDEVFTYKGRTFYLRYEDSWFNLTQNQYELNYFDDYPVPLDREVLRKGDKKYWTVTSENLKPLFSMQYVKILAQSQELDKYLRMNATYGLINLLISIINMLVIFKILRGL